MSFKNFTFNDHISNVLERHNYHTATPIQQQAIQPILDGKDLLGLAQTGTGKTAAFSLPLLHNLSRKNTKGANKALILSPTRELADQTANYINEFTDGLNLKCSVVYGGVSKDLQVKRLRKGVDIIVACPGRLLDLMRSEAVDVSQVGILVLDEADQMLDKGFLPDIKRIIKQLPKTRQNLIFSATMPNDVRSLIENLLVNPVKVSIHHKKPNKNISHTFIKVDSRKKNILLKNLLQERNTTQTIIFTRTKYKAKNLAATLTKKGFSATSLQGNLTQKKRQLALDGFKDGTYSILVATDIAARGIDVAGISHVINFDMPDTTEAYTHRTGRTGRANRSGQAITFATPEDQKMIKSLEFMLGAKVVYRAVAEEPEVQSPEIAAAKSRPVVKTGGRPSRKLPRKNATRRKRSAAFDFGI